MRERVVAQEVRPKVDVPVVPPKVALRSVPHLNTSLLCPQLQRPVTGQPSLVQPRQLAGDVAPVLLWRADLRWCMWLPTSGCSSFLLLPIVAELSAILVYE